jgi:hypothetical protein
MSMDSTYFNSKQSGSAFNAPPQTKPSPAVLNNIVQEAKKFESGSSTDIGASMPASKLTGACLDDNGNSCKTKVIVAKKSKFEEEYDRMVAAMKDAIEPIEQMIKQIRDKSGVIHEYQAAKGAVDPLVFKLRLAQQSMERDFKDENERFIKEVEVKATQKAYEILTEAARKEMNLPPDTDAAVEKAAIAAALEIRDQMMSNKATLHPRFVEQYEQNTLPELQRMVNEHVNRNAPKQRESATTRVANLMRRLFNKFVTQQRGASVQ